MTSILEYLQLLKQINNVPPEVKAVAIRDVEQIKKDKIYIPDATIRKSFPKSGKFKEIERDDEKYEQKRNKTTKYEEDTYNKREINNEATNRNIDEGNWWDEREEIFI